MAQPFREISGSRAVNVLFVCSECTRHNSRAARFHSVILKFYFHAPPEPFLSAPARWLTFGSAVSICFQSRFSDPAGLALAALLASGEKLRLPRIKLPLALFMLAP